MWFTEDGKLLLLRVGLSLSSHTGLCLTYSNIAIRGVYTRRHDKRHKYSLLIPIDVIRFCVDLCFLHLGNWCVIVNNLHREWCSCFMLLMVQMTTIPFITFTNTHWTLVDNRYLSCLLERLSVIVQFTHKNYSWLVLHFLQPSETKKYDSINNFTAGAHICGPESREQNYLR